MKNDVLKWQKRKKDIDRMVYYLENYWIIRGTHKEINRMIRDLLEEILDE